jgi:hypothetical protein
MCGAVAMGKGDVVESTSDIRASITTVLGATI